MCKINDVALMSRLIINKSSQLDTPELKKMFIVAMASVPDPSPKERELALKELEKPYDKRNMQKIISNNQIKINKQEFFNLMKLNYEKDGTIYKRYRKLFDKLIKSTHYDFDADDDFMSGYFFSKVVSYGNYFTITVDADFMPIMWHLRGGYVKLLTEDLVGFDSKFSMDLYKKIMSHANKKELDFTTKQLKELFNLSKDDYCRKNGKFERNTFEKRTLETALKEIDEKCKSITIFRTEDNSYYEKVKEKGKVKLYKMRYLVTDPHEIVNQEKVDQMSIYDYPETVQEDPRSRKLQRSKMVGVNPNVQKYVYNWLE